MLPAPVLLPRRRHFRRDSNPVLPRQRVLDFLLSRTRVTNLAFFLLSFLLSISLLFNIRHLVTTSSVPIPQSILSTVARGKTAAILDHLILVPCHAIWTGPSADLRLDEDKWVLEPYQQRSGRVEAFFQHILRGAELSLKDEHSLVVFSGGQTRPGTTITEGESYLQLALQADVFRTSFSSVIPRATSENYALDSYQNLLFSVARFHEYTGRYPDKITVVGYEMKRRRFTELHREAIRWPKDKFSYIGIDPTDGPEEKAVAKQGELQNGYLPYTKDVYGCHTQLLSKRLLRNPHIRFHSYYTSSPELAELLDWCPDDTDTLFDKELPWL
ncbi:hypothetical protein K435DRAFT_848786 [Dendrothele bispora CBS 962.96]|uniref:DUF218 domain-containing protein n=1 Tax=Dendrothele bispora (strain CBS 962.96) TaxID=1314807 RepID=A0A4S8MU17_DENBC|nr:hypothetical protein K435DRAFT_848786 [Dendrothele bispora CBS 962.96]